MYELQHNSVAPPEPMYAADLQIGDLALIVDKDSQFQSHIILRHYEGFVDLHDPRHTWPELYNMKVRKLAPGESVTLTSIPRDL